MRTKQFKSIATLLAASCIWCCHDEAIAQNDLPVYKVLEAGANAEQARLLANLLEIPFNQLSISNGQLSHLNPSNYMAVPTAPVTDAKIIRALEGQTENPFPNIPLRFEQIDFEALAKLAVPSGDVASRLAGTALGQTGLDPQYGKPVISHSMLNAFYLTDNNVIISNRHALDTKVTYEFITPEGFRLIGPGAQVQFTFAPNGQVSQLVYAARKLERSEPVPIITPSDAIRRAARMFPADAKITAELVYWCPPFWRPSPGRWEIRNVLPSYLLTAKSSVTDPRTGRTTELEELTHVMPATESQAYVPAVQLEAFLKDRTQVFGVATITGGLPPYTLEWSGSEPNLAYSNGPSVLYTPRMVVGMPELSAHLSAKGQLVISWPHDPATAPALNLESTPSMSRPSWKPFNPVITTNSHAVVTLDIANSEAMFFRMHLGDQIVKKLETISVKVTDANGVQVQASQTLQVDVLPMPRPIPSGIGLNVVGVSDWGTESSVDTELGWHDRSGWNTGMILGGAGTRRFQWLDGDAWKKDFIQEPTGDNDAMLDNADITLYIGHGNPQVITFTGGSGPDPTVLYYNQATQSWGNVDQEWLCLLSCSVLKFDDAAGNVWQRWGPNFNGLHMLTGFSTGAGAMTGFPFAFSLKMLGGIFGLSSAKPILHSWFAAAHEHGTGSPVAMGPIGPGGVWDFGDYYWGRGPVGPTIRASQIRGWWYTY